MSNRKLVTGGDGPMAPAAFYNPLTAKWDSDICMLSSFNPATGERHWWPRSLSYKKIKEGKTQGYRRQRTHPDVPLGWVWIQTKASLTPGQIKRRAALKARREAAAKAKRQSK